MSKPETSLLVAAIDRALGTPTRPPRLSTGYVVGLMCAGGLALLLPVVYVLVPIGLALAGAAVLVTLGPYVHGLYAGVVVVGLGLGPIVAAGAMLTPLLRRRQRCATNPIVVSKVSEPVLHHLIERIARAIDAPVPHEVHLTHEANAAHAIVEGKHVLILGTTLIATLDAAELACLIAHELGHARQGFARRFILGVGRVFSWLGGAIENAEFLEESEPDGLFEHVILGATQLGILLLTFVMRIADVLLVALGREMELDADRHAVVVTGPAAVASLLERCSASHLLLQLHVAAMAEGIAPAPDNVASWIAALVAEMPDMQRRRVARVFTRDAAGVIHPPYDTRVKNARSVGSRGIFALDVPAVDLFRSFDAYAVRATREAMVPLLRAGARLEPTAKLLEQRKSRSTEAPDRALSL